MKRQYRYLFYKMVIKPFNNIFKSKNEDLLYKFFIKPWEKITQFFFLAFIYIPLKSFLKIVSIIWKGFLVTKKEDYPYGFFYVFRLMVTQVALFIQKYFILPAYIIYYFISNDLWKGRILSTISKLYHWIWFKYDWKSNLILNKYEIHNILDYLGEASHYDPRPFYMQFWQKGFFSFININFYYKHSEDFRFFWDMFLFVVLSLLLVKPIMLVFEGFCFVIYNVIIFIARKVYSEDDERVLLFEYICAHLRYTIYWGLRDLLYWSFLQICYLVFLALPYLLIIFIYTVLKKIVWIIKLTFKMIYNFKWGFRYFKATIRSLIFEAPVFMKDLLQDNTVKRLLYMYFTETYIYIAFVPYYWKFIAFISQLKNAVDTLKFFIHLFYSITIDIVTLLKEIIIFAKYVVSHYYNMKKSKIELQELEDKRIKLEIFMQKGYFVMHENVSIYKKLLIFYNKFIIFVSKCILLIDLRFSKSFIGRFLFNNRRHFVEFNKELIRIEKMLNIHRKNNFVNLNIEDYFSPKNMKDKKSFLILIWNLSKWNLSVFDKHLYLFAMRYFLQYFNQHIITFRKLDLLTFNIFMNNVGIHKWKSKNLKQIWTIVPTIYNHINFDKYMILKRQQEKVLWGLYKKSDNLKDTPRLFNIIRFLHALSGNHLFKTYKVHKQFMGIWLDFIYILLPKIKSTYLTDIFIWKDFDKILRWNTSTFEQYRQERRRRKQNIWKLDWKYDRYKKWFKKVKEFYTEIDLKEGLYNSEELFKYNVKKGIIRKERMMDLQYYTEAEKLYHEFIKDKKVDHYMLKLKFKLRKKLYRLKRLKQSKTFNIEFWDYITSVTPVVGNPTM